jgi:hypothetical protein
MKATIASSLYYMQGFFRRINSFNWYLNFESSSRKYQIANMLGLIVDQLATERRSLEAPLAVRVYSSNSRPRTLT